MQKGIFLLFYGLFSVLSGDGYSQILITEMGNLRYFNTLDSGEAAKLTAIAFRCYCLLHIEDSTHQMLLRLDIKTDTSRSDSLFYILDYNNLSGNYSASDSLSEPAGIYIRARDSVLKPQIILRLLDYGIHHFAELKERLRTGVAYDPAFVGNLLKQKVSFHLKKVMGYCK